MLLIWDLRVVLYVVLCAGIVAAGGVAWLVGHRPPRRGPGLDHQEPGLLEILNQAPLGVLMMEDRRLLYLNAMARELLHLSEGATDVLPSTDWTGLLWEDLDVARQDVNDDTSGRSMRVAGRLRTVTFASGTTVRWWAAAQEDRDIVIVFDISAQQRAVQTGRSLISDLGHELRTPIATLLTHLQILGLDDVGPEVQVQSLHLAHQEAQRMSRLVNDMLELGRLEMVESVTRRPVNLLKLVEETVVQVSPQSAEQGIDLNVTSTGSLPLVMGNADRLRQVLLNLLDNAVKYAGAHAQVTVSLEVVEAGVRCSCRDTGPGIAPEHLPYITRRFYRAAPDTIQGSGLGLALVEEILRRHGSALEIISPVSEGRGTCARFVLPLTENPAPATMQAAEPVRSVHL